MASPNASTVVVKSPLTQAGEVVLLLIPPILLGVAAVRTTSSETQQLFWFGAGFLAFLLAAGTLTRLFKKQPNGPTLLFFYGLGLGWVFLANTEQSDWYLHLAQAIMLVIPLAYFTLLTLGDIGAPQLRRARLLAQRIADRKEWPADLESCRSLPDVKAFREALHLDAGPALALLHHSRPQVQIAALSALDFRKNWRQGQAEVVLQLALRAEEPAVRAAALAALSNGEGRELIEALAEFLRDPSPLVRRAATQAVLWDTEHRWLWIRHSVRRALGDPLCQEDGALRHEGTLFTREAVDDLVAWTAEKGLLGMRAALTLGMHYSQAINEGAEPELIEALRKRLLDGQTPAVFRIELSRVLFSHQLLGIDALRQLLDPGNPAPLRLIAVEALLADNEAPEAVAALRELGRLPNREIALATADVVQRKLRVEMGLPLGQPMPPVHSRQATEITRRVKAWANEEELLDAPHHAMSRHEKRAWSPQIDN